MEPGGTSTESPTERSEASASRNKPSVLDYHGAELMAVVTPTSLCMALVVWLVHVKHLGTQHLQQVSISNLYYQEQVRNYLSTTAVLRYIALSVTPSLCPGLENSLRNVCLVVLRGP